MSQSSLANRVMDGMARLRNKELSSLEWIKNNVTEGSCLEGETTRNVVGSSTDLKRQRLCQAHLMAGPNGLTKSVDAPLDTFDLWSNASDGKHLLGQLALTPYLIVDVRPTSAEGDDEIDQYCVKHYGVTKDQLFHLARRGLIGFNLVSFASEEKNYFPKYRSSELVAQILEDEKVTCWSTSLRRDAFFDRITDKPYPEILEEAEELILAPGLEFVNSPPGSDPTQEDRDVETYVSKLRHKGEGAAFAATHHYAYLRACGGKSVQERLDELIGSRLSSKDFGRVAVELRGLKTAHATRYSASLGAQYHMSRSAYETCARRFCLIGHGEIEMQLKEYFPDDTARVVFPAPGDERYFVQHVRRFIEQVVDLQVGPGDEIDWFGLDRYQGKSLETLLPRPMEQGLFEAFVTRIEEGQKERKLYNNLLNAVTRFRLEEGNVDELHDIVKNLTKHHRDVEKSLLGTQRHADKIQRQLAYAIGDNIDSLHIAFQFVINAAGLYGMETPPHEDVVSQAVIHGAMASVRYPIPFCRSLQLYKFRNKNKIHFHINIAELETFAQRRLNAGR